MGNQMQRDQSLGADDRFMMAIDTFADGRSGYYFEINPSGAMGDGLVLAGAGSGNGQAAGVNRSWDGIWLPRISHDERGWSAEIEIPFNTINFKPDATSWGINFQRTIRRKIEETLWTGWARNQGLTFSPLPVACKASVPAILSRKTFDFPRGCEPVRVLARNGQCHHAVLQPPHRS